MPWYTGPTLWQVMMGVTSNKKSPKPIERSFRMSINFVCKISGVGTVVVGKVQSGSIQKGDKVLIGPKMFET